jgi:hypothetical protein
LENDIIFIYIWKWVINITLSKISHKSSTCLPIQLLRKLIRLFLFLTYYGINKRLFINITFKNSSHEWIVSHLFFVCCMIVTSIKIIKTTILTKIKVKVGLVPNPNHETRQTRTRTWQVQTKIQQKFIPKQKQNKVMIKNMSKTGVEQTKGNRDFYLYLYPLGT